MNQTDAATRHFIVATAGHVDHGKSALVKALTGTDPDRLPEEKARQITIDLGFAELNLHGPKGETIHAGIVDVPGHEDFVRNMIAGVGSTDLVLFVVAADDGWMPQTEEHLQILNYLGVERAVVALSKSDLGEVEKRATEIREQLRGTAFANSEIVPVSVRDGDGLEDLRRAVVAALSTDVPQRGIGKPRLFVDRSFTLRGIGTVVTGTLTGGTLRAGQSVVIQPRNVPAHIRALQSHGRDVAAAGPGTRTAINLPDMAVADIKRGDVITTAGVQPTSTVDVVLERSPRAREKMRSLKGGAAVYLHHGTARVRAKIVFLEAEALSPGKQAIAQLRLDSPILAFLGDRFVIRDPSEQRTLAGGVVLDPAGKRAAFRTNRQVTLLSARTQAYRDVDACVTSEIVRDGTVERSFLLARSRFSTSEVEVALQRLHESGRIFLDERIAIEKGKWHALRARVTELIDASHNKHPERNGLQLNELRAALHEESTAVIDALISNIGKSGFVQTGSTIARSSHRRALPPEMRDAAEKLLHLISDTPSDPPSRKQIAPDASSRRALSFLIDQGEVVEVSEDLVLARDAFERMKEGVAAFISKNGSATVSELRQALQTSRRTLVPLLERLDRERVTKRVGDQRMLAKEPVASAKPALD
jgi:selenocysteine-specific elongation factor